MGGWWAEEEGRPRGNRKKKKSVLMRNRLDSTQYLCKLITVVSVEAGSEISIR